jgi:hypothetical protein
MAQLNIVPALDAQPPANSVSLRPQLPATATLPVAPPVYRQQQRLERENLDACREFQDYYDEALCRRVGTQAPPPKPGQDVMDYRTECCRTFKRAHLPQNHSLYKMNWRGLADDHVTLRNFEPQLMEACVVEAYNPNNVPKGQLKPVKELNEFGQTVSTRYIGQESFVKLPNFGTDIQATGGYRPGRRVVSFNTTNGPMDASGRYMR